MEEHFQHELEAAYELIDAMEEYFKDFVDSSGQRTDYNDGNVHLPQHLVEYKDGIQHLEGLYADGGVPEEEHGDFLRRLEEIKKKVKVIEDSA